MKSATATYAESELEQVAHCFAHWRHHRCNRTSPIPPPLWQQAVSLASKLPLPLVAKRLGVKSTTLKQHCAAHQGAALPETTGPALGFVDVTPSATWTFLAQPTEVDLQRADGARLRIHCREPQFPLAALVRTFLEAH